MIQNPDNLSAEERFARREELVDEINRLVTRYGPRYMVRGMDVLEAYERIIECIEHLANKVSDDQASRATK